MALVQKEVYVDFVVTDAGGNKSNIRHATDYADLDALAAGVTAGDITAMIASLNAVTDGVITGYSYGVRFGEDSTFFAAAGVEVENVAIISAKIAGEVNKSTTLRVPAPNDGIFLQSSGPDRNTIDPTDTALVTWLDNFSTGHLLVSDGEQIADPAVAGNFKGKRIHRASRKG